MESNEMELVVIKSQGGELSVKDFADFKNKVVGALENYKVFVPQNSADYKAIKQARADLNNVAKSINDTKIAYVSDTTKLICDQCKELCDLIKAKSHEFDIEAKTYETTQLNKEVKEKTKYVIEIKCLNEEELNKVKAVLDTRKFIKYEIKEK